MKDSLKPIDDIHDVGDIYGRQDCMSMVDANRITGDIGSGGVTTLEWLRDVIECDGTPNDSKFAAILRALILAQGNTHCPPLPGGGS